MHMAEQMKNRTLYTMFLSRCIPPLASLSVGLHSGLSRLAMLERDLAIGGVRVSQSVCRPSVTRWFSPPGSPGLGLVFAGRRCMSVRPSVCHVRKLRQNE